MSSSGGIERRKRIRVEGERARGVVRALVVAQGFAVVEENEPADLAIFEAAGPHEPISRRDGLPAIAVSRRRLRESELRALKDAGARAVIDADSSVLDLACAISEIAFGTRAAMRRYGRAFGGMPVRFRAAAAGEQGGVGRLLGIGRCGAFIATEQRIPEGTPIELELDLSGRTVSLRGRVAFVEEASAGEGIAIEFALDDGEVAPKLFVAGDEGSGGRRPAEPFVRHASGSR
jgi:hypothetical protein